MGAIIIAVILPRLAVFKFGNGQHDIGGHIIFNGGGQSCPWRLTKIIAADDIEAVTKAKELNIELERWRQGTESEVSEKGSIGWLIIEYKKSSRFKKLADSTQKLYQWNFLAIAKGFRGIPVDKITRQRALAFYEALITVGGKRKPSQIMQIARVMFQYGMDRGYNTTNPFKELRVEKAKPRQGIISPEAITVAKAKARELGLPSIARAIQIGYDAGQRPGDIRMLPRSNYDGQWLRIKQSKTGAIVDIPVYKIPSLKAELDTIEHDSLLILHEERTRKAYGKDMLCRRVREVFEAAGLSSDSQFRDLRRTAVVRLAEAGCTIPEICSITGHSLQEATGILKVYLPMTRAMAENAADKVEKLNKR